MCHSSCEREFCSDYMRLFFVGLSVSALPTHVPDIGSRITDALVVSAVSDRLVKVGKARISNDS